MPTIFEQIETAVSGNPLTAQLTAQAGQISTASTQLSGLIHGNLPAVGAFTSALGGLAAPSLSIPASFSGTFSSLTSVIPSDLSGVTGGVTTALGGLTVSVESNIAVKMRQIVEALQALQQLLEKGFAPISIPPSGSAAAGSSAPSVPPAAPAPPAVPGPPAAPGPAGPAPGPAPGGATPDPVAEARQRRIEAINQANTLLSMLPAFDVPTFIAFLNRAAKSGSRELIPFRKLPIVDDLIDMLSTVVALREMDAAALAVYIHDTTEALASFLTNGGLKPLADVIARLSALSSHLDSGGLKTQSAGLAVALAHIGAAVDGGDVSGTAADIAAANAALDILLPLIAGLNSNLFSGQVDSATDLFELLPVDLERHIRRVVQSVKPVDQLTILQSIGDRLNASIQTVPLDEVATDVDNVLQFALKALNIVDVIPIREPVLTAIDGVKSASDGIDHLLAEAATATGQLFAQVDQLLAQIDVSQVTNGIQKAITDFQNTLQQKVNDLFEPVRTAIADGVSQINSAISGFHPDDIVAALKDVIQKLAGVLQGPDVQGAINTIQQAIQSATDQIKGISFKPLTGQVTGDIDQVTAALKAIDPNVLSLELKVALKGAVAILPGDLKPVTDPLKAEFSTVVETVAKPILVQAEAPAQRLTQQITGFSPANLIGDQLSKPLQDLVGQLEQFKPSSLLAPVEQALNGLKDQLRRTADPAPLFKPLEDVFDQLTAQLDKLKPEDLVKPLNDLVQGAIDKVLSVLPVDAILQAFNDILARIKSVSDTAAAVKTTIEKGLAIFDGLAEPEAQLRTWLQPLFDHIDQISNVSSLQPSFDKLSAAIDGLKADAMRSALDAVYTPLRTGIADLNPGSALTDVAAAYGSIRPDRVTALAASVQTAGIQALIARFNPVAADFARPFEGLKRWLADLTRHRASFETLMLHWDLRFNGANGPLSGFVHPAVNADDLKSIFRAAVEGEVIQPLSHFLGAVHTLIVSAKAPLAKVTAAIDAFDDKVQDVLLGPTAFGGIVDAVNSLVARLRNINLNFLVTQLNTTFRSVKAKLQAVSPAAIRAAVQQAIDAALNLLDVHQLLPQAAIAAIDNTYQQIIDDLKAFDPKKLIVEVVQPEFDSTIVPILKTFDITLLLKAVIDTLDALQGELGGELDEVNQHYKAMLDAVPSISLADLSGAASQLVGSVAGDIGGSIGF